MGWHTHLGLNLLLLGGQLLLLLLELHCEELGLGLDLTEPGLCIGRQGLYLIFVVVLGEDRGSLDNHVLCIGLLLKL